MPSNANDATSTSNRRGRPPPSSVRALTRLALQQQQVLNVRHSTMDQPISDRRDASPILTGSICFDVDIDAGSVPRSATETPSGPVRCSDTALTPAPLNPRSRRRPGASLAAFPPPRSVPTDNPGFRTMNFSCPSSPTTSSAPLSATIITPAQSMQQTIELHRAMLELDIELDHLRADERLRRKTS